MLRPRDPNEEQIKAIEHTGGVLLNAGAGAGKTFVLVEHIVYLVDDFIEKNKELNEFDFLLSLRTYLSKIVLMTFTNKAAGELSVRLIARIDWILEQNLEGHSRWELAKEALRSMTVGTIHGFCIKLFQQGYLPNIDIRAEILEEEEYQTEFTLLFEDIFSEILNSKSFVSESFLINKKNILNALKNIFMNPELRRNWLDDLLADQSFETIALFFDNYFSITNSLNVFKEKPSLENIDVKDQKLKWFQATKDLSLILESDEDEVSLKSLEAILNSKISKPRKKELKEIAEWIGSVNEFKKFLKTNLESLKFYYFDKEGRSTLEEWKKEVFGLVKKLESRYHELGGMHFSDLEYYLLKGLENRESLENIQKDFEYFIVDEFQDTSQVQFSILKNLIGNDYSKLFCVGDVKQAIYGFRGGEIAVFQQCMDNIPKNLNLKMNYRSQEKIIDFNNTLFENIFKKGKDFKGDDPYQVEVVYQDAPIKNVDGEVSAWTLNIEREEKLSTSEMNQFEAQAIFEIIKKFPNESFCVLYKKLSPSLFLLERLMKESVRFGAQAKVPLSEDPILCIFNLLIEFLLENKKPDLLEKKVFFLEKYLQALGIKNQQLGSALTKFELDINTIGLYESFKQFIFALGLSNSNPQNNTKKIKLLINSNYENLEKILVSLKELGGSRYSIEFERGEGQKRVRLMSAHSSKGLEFEHIILGGIHTNGTSVVDQSFIGKEVGSFKWKKSPSQKKAFKTPQFIIEDLIKSKKDFSESKRLFYVDSTRAERKVSWVDLSQNEKGCCFSQSSWINGIRSADNISFNEKEILLDLESDDNELNSQDLPLFHRDDLGLMGRSQESANENLGVISELSVTKLAYLSECPHKFFLSNICKISSDDLDLLDLEKDNIEIGAGEKRAISSSERGTKIHWLIEHMINHNFSLPIEDEKLLKKKDQVGLDWIKTELQSLSNFKFISEEEIKFSFFGHMITGIPDLVAFSPKNEIEIWDFKTGLWSDDKNINYQFQLACYAYAYFELGKINKGSSVKLVIAYIDEREKQEYTFLYNELRDFLFSVWSKIDSYNQVNTQHCNSCIYKKICTNACDKISS